MLMVFWMIFWDSERSNPIRKYFIPRIQHWFIWLGLTAEWKMFSPDPPLRNIWPLVKFTFSNDEFAIWEPESISKMSVINKIRYKKFHKVYFEVSRAKGATQAKRDFIDYLLTKYSFNDSCIKVEVYTVSQKINSFYKQSEPEPEIFKQLVFTFHPELNLSNNDNN
ncbi:hypothetical protein [Roseivirga sp.]|uniref:hypothetical protein n=1 Tax=Roseivirga sp. TaxID=1964215 RepID=UPI003B8CA270